MRIKILLGAVLAMGALVVTRGQGTAFTYQGRLIDNAAPATGSYDLRFYLRDAMTGGNPVGPTNTLAPVNVTNGLFTVTLDFGAGIFSGPARWLEIGVRTNGSVSAYTTLSPRQNLTPTPYAITAASVVAGGVTGTFPGTVNFNNPANTFVGNGSGLTDLNAWALDGNAGTVAGANFLGTTDNQALELKVNGSRVLRLEPNSDNAPNVLGGSALNDLGPSVAGSVIAGGGGNEGGIPYANMIFANFGIVGGGSGNILHDASSHGVIAGGFKNVVEGNSASSFIGGGRQHKIHTNAVGATIVGGDGNQIGASAQRSTIAGGEANTIQRRAHNSVLGGGNANEIGENSAFSFIGSGDRNTIGPASIYSVLVGGSRNDILTNSLFATIGGGENNTIGSVASAATIAGGQENFIHDNATFGAIGGGAMNGIGSNSQYSFVGGGHLNEIERRSQYSVISGGHRNQISVDCNDSAIAGGGWNTIYALTSFASISGGYSNFVSESSHYSSIGGGTKNAALGPYATIPGGSQNVAGEQCFAAGHRAKATDFGSFVWADATDADFGTSSPKQFNIRAGGGVNIGATNSAGALHIAGPVGTPPAGLNPEDNGIAMGLEAHTGYKWIQSYGGILSLNPVGNRVGIGTTTPDFLLHVQGDAGKPGGGSWSVASDARLKKNVHQLAGALDQLLQMRGVSFEYNEPEKIHELPGERIGLLAQEVEKVFPDWVEQGRDGFKRLTVRGFEALTIEAFREMRAEKNARIADLEAQVAQLKSAQNQWEDRFAAVQKTLENLTKTNGEQK